MANEAVLKYLTDTNRPYSCTDVTANLRGAYNKAAVQRALDALSESAQIRCKLYGKQKVYVAIQSDGAQKSGEDDVGELDELYKTLTAKLAEKIPMLKSAESALKALLSSPTTAEAERQLSDTAARVQGLRSKLEELKCSSGIVSKEKSARVSEQHGRLLKEYKKRKSIATQMMDAILEGYPKPKKTLIEELCMETDEMVEFTPTTR